MHAALDPHNIPTGHIDVGGKPHMRTAEGALMPVELIKDQHKLEDQMVRRIISFAEDLSARIDRFAGHTFEDIATFQSLLEEEYKAPRKGGKKGNVTFYSYDGLMKVEVRMDETQVFGAELQTAKALIDECINDWASDSNAPLRMLINQAFQVDQAGRINRNEVLKLRNHNIVDERWVRAMEAITASIRVVGVKTRYYFSRRPDRDSDFKNITINLAGAKAPRQAEMAA